MTDTLNENTLAIVIPAYKHNFLRATLESLNQQTNKNFTVYIGDDNSPEKLWDIVADFTTSLNINYKKFEENLGGKDLVSHWNRCIELVKEETWIWLFSDDDLLGLNCVETFYKYIDNNPAIELVHFPVKIINQDGIEIENFGHSKEFPPVLTSAEFYAEKTKGNIQSFVVEYVFKRTLFEEEDGLVNFDLAWCADDATWVKFSRKSGIYTVEGAYVYWRYSGLNISSLTGNLSVLHRKLEAKLSYVSWVNAFFKKHGITHTLDKVSLTNWFLLEVKENRQLPILNRLKITYHYTNRLLGILGAFISCLYILAFSAKKGLLFVKSS